MVLYDRIEKKPADAIGMNLARLKLIEIQKAEQKTSLHRIKAISEYWATIQRQKEIHEEHSRNVNASYQSLHSNRKYAHIKHDEEIRIPN